MKDLPNLILKIHLILSIVEVLVLAFAISLTFIGIISHAWLKFLCGVVLTIVTLYAVTVELSYWNDYGRRHRP